MRPTRCEISKQAFHNNFNALKALMPERAEVLAVVKANAYGHGSSGMVSLLQSAGVRRFAVATVTEALKLRYDGVTDELLLLGGPYGEYALCLREKLTPVFSDEDPLREWALFLKDRGQSAPCHLKFDTGMGRLGFLTLDTVMDVLKAYPQVRVQGMMTHLAVADESSAESKEFTCRQLDHFQAMYARLAGIRPELEYAHVANSALLLRRDIPPACHLLVRPGLSLYGIAPQAWLGEGLRPLTLEPVLTWKTAVHSVKSLETGTSISYGRTFVTARPSRIAVLPVGYADGYPRQLSNRASVLVRGKRAPVVGRVCMDLTMVDVTDIDGVTRGDEVVLLGRQGTEEIPVETLAEWEETIPYEIFCRISERVERLYL